MVTKTNGNQFREDEIVIMTHWDKKEKKWVKNVYPKVGGEAEAGLRGKRTALDHHGNHQVQ